MGVCYNTSNKARKENERQNNSERVTNERECAARTHIIEETEREIDRQRQRERERTEAEFR